MKLSGEIEVHKRKKKETIKENKFYLHDRTEIFLENRIFNVNDAFISKV
jgi:hypothetical protein